MKSIDVTPARKEGTWDKKKKGQAIKSYRGPDTWIATNSYARRETLEKKLRRDQKNERECNLGGIEKSGITDLSRNAGSFERGDPNRKKGNAAKKGGPGGFAGVVQVGGGGAS